MHRFSKEKEVRLAFGNASAIALVIGGDSGKSVWREFTQLMTGNT